MKIEEWPLITVIIPTIGREKFIVDAVKSVINQSYRNIEILISENATNISTEKLLAKAQIFDERINILFQKNRLGLVEHLNLCLSQATGIYFMILSDDDLLSRDYIKEMVECMIRYPNVTAVIGRQIVINENGSINTEWREKGSERHQYSGNEFLEKLLDNELESLIVTFFSLFANRELVISLGGFIKYPDGSHSDNYLFWQLAMLGNILVGKEPFYYRVYNSSYGMSTSFLKLFSATYYYTINSSKLLQENDNQGKFYSNLIPKLANNNYLTLENRYNVIYRDKCSYATRMAYSFLIIFFKFYFNVRNQND